jgi:hypothetical protein
MLVWVSSLWWMEYLSHVFFNVCYSRPSIRTNLSIDSSSRNFNWLLILRNRRRGSGMMNLQIDLGNI